MKSVPGKRFGRRVIGLSLVALLSLVLELLRQKLGGAIWVVLEVGVWGVYLFRELELQLFRLKSRPDSNQGVSLSDTMQGDALARAGLVAYVLVLGIFAVYRVIAQGQFVTIGPGLLFLLLAPAVLFAFWRQYRYEVEVHAT